jgi:hypothetical protein
MITQKYSAFQLSLRLLGCSSTHSYSGRFRNSLAKEDDRKHPSMKGYRLGVELDVLSAVCL